MKSRPAIVAAIFLLVASSTVTYAIVSGNQPSPAGSAHWVTDGINTLNQDDLASRLLPLDGVRSHEFRISLAPTVVNSDGTGAQVRLHYAPDGNAPNTAAGGVLMTFAGRTSAGDLLYKATLAPAQLQSAASNPEHTVNFCFTIRDVAGQTTDCASSNGAPYRYLWDAAAPRIASLAFNGAGILSINGSQPVTAATAIDDRGALQSVSLTLTRNGFTHTYAMTTSASGASHSFPSGLGLPNGVYAAAVIATDYLGHSSTATFGNAVRIGDSAPAPTPPGSSHTGTDGTLTITQAGLTAGGKALSGLTNHVIQISSTPAVDDEQVAGRIYYTTDGSAPTAASPSKSLTFSPAGAWQATLQPQDLGLGAAEGTVRFILRYESNYFPTVHDPTQAPSYSYVSDALAPRVNQVKLNGNSQQAVDATAPLSIQAMMQDLGGVHTARAIIESNGQTKATVNLVPGQWTGSFPNGVQIPNGVYDVRIQATDMVGNAADTLHRGVLIVGSGTPPPVSGDSTQASDGTSTLRVAELDGTHSLQRSATHTLTLNVRKDLPAEDLSVGLHHAVTGTPTMTGAGIQAVYKFSTASSHVYQATLPASSRSATAPEGPVRYGWVIQSPYFSPFHDTNGGAFYSYIDDGLAPRITAVTINDGPEYNGPATTALSLKVAHQDASTITAASLQAIDSAGNALRTWPATILAGTIQASLPNGAQLPRGVYDIRATLTDAAGNQGQATFAGLMHIGDSAPLPLPAADAVQVSSGGIRVHEPDLVAGSGALPGESPNRFQVSTEPPAADETVSVKLHYATGLSPNTLAIRTMNLASTDSGAWTYAVTLPVEALEADSGAEHMVSFYITIDSNRYPDLRVPATGMYSYLWDAQAPSLSSARFNGEPSLSTRPLEPFEASVAAIDAAGLDGVRLELVRDGAVRYAADLAPAGPLFLVREQGGLGIAEGTYDARFTATDVLGHSSAPMLVPAAITIDASAPAFNRVLLNGETFLVTQASQSLTLAALGLSNDTAAAQLHVLNPSLSPLRTYDLAATSEPGTWSLTVPETNLNDGTYRMRLDVTDQAGNQAQSVLPYSPLTIDNAAPVVSLVAVDYPDLQRAAKRDEPVGVRIDVLDDTALHAVSMRIGSTSYVMSHDGGTRYHGQFMAPLMTGKLPITILATDEAGNARQEPLHALVDNQPPTIQEVSIVTPTAGQAKPGETATIIVHAADAATGIDRVYVDATAINPQIALTEAFRYSNSNTFQVDVPITASAGSHSVPALAYDWANNRGTASGVVNVRTEGPAIQNVTLDGKDVLGITASRAIKFRVTLATNEATTAASIRIEDADHTLLKVLPLTQASATVWEATVDPQLVAGAYFVEARVTDGHDRTSSNAHAKPRLIIDNAAPVIDSFDVDTGYPNQDGLDVGFFNDAVALKATITDLSPVTATVVVATPSGAQISVPLTATGTTHQASKAFQEVGVFNATLTATDAAGKTATAKVTFKLLAKAGTAPSAVINLRITTPNSDTTPTADWEVPAVTGGTILGYAVGVDATASLRISVTDSVYTHAVALANGSHTVSVRAVNDKGLWGPPSTITFAITTTGTGTGSGNPGSGNPGTGTGQNGTGQNGTGNTTQGGSFQGPNFVPSPILALLPEQLPPYSKQVPTLQWRIMGTPALWSTVDCVEISIRATKVGQTPGTFGAVECVELGTFTSSAFGATDTAPGMTLEAVGRIKLLSGQPHTQVSFGSTILDTTKPVLKAPPTVTDQDGDGIIEANETVTVTIRSDDDVASATLRIKDSAGNVVSAVPMLPSGNGTFSGTYTAAAPGTFSTDVMLQDHAGNSNTVNVQSQSAVVQPSDESKSREARMPNWLVAAIVIGILIVLTVAAYFAYRWYQKRKAMTDTAANQGGTKVGEKRNLGPGAAPAGGDLGLDTHSTKVADGGRTLGDGQASASSSAIAVHESEFGGREVHLSNQPAAKAEAEPEVTSNKTTLGAKKRVMGKTSRAKAGRDGVIKLVVE